MKPEQSVNRFSQGLGGHVIVDSSGDATFVAEFDLLYHEVLAISNLLQTWTSAKVMNHLGTTIHHDLSGKKMPTSMPMCQNFLILSKQGTILSLQMCTFHSTILYQSH